MSVRILLTDNDLGDTTFESDLLGQHLDAELVVRDCRSERDVLQAVREVSPHALMVQWAPITDSVLAAAPECRLISRMGIGLDMIDLEAAASRGVRVVNVPHYCTEEVATHAVALALSLWRRLPELDQAVRDGTWDSVSAAPRIRRLSASTVGLIGMGRIGRRVADAFAGWGARVIAHDPVQRDDPYPRVSMAQIAADSDLVSLHAPLVAETRHCVSAEFLSACSRKPIVINVSRGALMDTAAVADALKTGEIAGAGIDVFENEPLPADDPLRSAPHTIFTPHAAWCSSEALPALRESAVMNVVDGFGSSAKSRG